MTKNLTLGFDSRKAKITRRDLARFAGLGLLGAGCTSWFPLLARAAARDSRQRKHCILLWMAGGPSQTDTFDMKPGHVNGGQFKEVSTKATGLRFSEHLPKLGQHADQLAIVRSLSTKEGDHARGTHLMRTGQRPGGPVRYPAFPATLAKELADDSAPLPNYVAISTNSVISPAAFGSGFLGPRYAPVTVGTSNPLQSAEGAAEPSEDESKYASLRVDYLERARGVTSEQSEARRQLWRFLQDGFLARRPTPNAIAHDTVYRRAMRMMDSQAREAFDLSVETTAVRDAYGPGRFGQGCLLARRLIERGVPFVEVGLGVTNQNPLGWDTHANNFETVKQLSQELDNGWGTLMTELSDRGLLESTTILWMGEFGRTPVINPNGGRDHFPAAWSCVFGGGGIAGGQAFGKTNESGTEVAEGKVDVGHILVTLCHALGIDPDTENTTGLGRPIHIAEGEPIKDILA